MENELPNLSKQLGNSQENPIAQLQRIIIFQRQQLQLQSQQLMAYAKENETLRSQFSTLQNQLILLQKQNPAESEYSDLMIGNLACEFVESFDSDKTKSTYNEGFKCLYQQGFLDPLMKLSEFKKLNGENILDNIRQNYKAKKGGKYGEASNFTKQTRSAQLISFSKFLQRKTQGYIHQIMANRMCVAKTFRNRRAKSAASPLTNAQVEAVLYALKSFSLKAYLTARLQIIGCRRIGELLNCKIEDLDLSNKRIFFKPLKKKNFLVQPIPIYLPPDLLEDIKKFVENRTKGFLFTKLPTKKSPLEHDNSQAMTLDQISKLYFRGWFLAHQNNKENTSNKKPFMPKLITHCFRAYGITNLYKRDIDSSKICEIAGHQSVDMTNYYNLNNIEDNITKKLHVFDYNSK